MKKIYFLSFIALLFFASCAKKGHIDVKSAGFWINNNRPPFDVQFYLDVAYQPKEISYNWDFGDGTTSSEKEPHHIYAKTGIYHVKLTIINYKTTVEKTFDIDVSQDPMPIKVDFSYQATNNKYYNPTEINFYNKTQYASEFFWNFGDGHGTDDADPTHIYDSTGTFNVYLYAYCNGDTAASVMQLQILPPPTKLSIDVVSIWLPDELMGGMYDLHYYTDIFEETPSNLGGVIADDNPFGWIIGEDLYYFDGNYDAGNLYFEVWEAHNNQAPTYSFGTKFSDIKNSFYPDTLWWDDGNGFAAEVLVSYED